MIYENTEFFSIIDSRQVFREDLSERPYLCVHEAVDRFPGRFFPWHWHSHVEINFVEKGEYTVNTSDRTFPAKAGDLVFVNAREMHQAESAEKRSGTVIYTCFFKPQFLSGVYNSELEMKYITPVTGNRNFQGLLISPDSYDHIVMLEHFLKMIELDRNEPFGYEMEVRAELSRFWLMLLRESELEKGVVSEKSLTDQTRMKAMLTFINEHYAEEITLADVASAGNIGSRECSRCFIRSINLSPMTYLNDYRVHKAGDLLLGTDKSILEISSECGFSSESYFSKVFRKIMGMSPRDYRKRT